MQVSPQMTSSLGNVSFGVLAEIVAGTTSRIISSLQRKNLVIEQMNINYLKLIQIESVLEV